jgi:F-type H+-transporting ATPase subunit epsilon
MSDPATAETMKLRIQLPFAVLLETGGIRRMIAETSGGFFGLWPHRLDCAAALVPGIFTYEDTDGNEQFVAVDRGVLVKTGLDVSVSVRNAVSGGDLGSLRKLVEEQFVQIGEGESQTRALLAKMESEMIRETTRIRHV